MKVGSLVVCVKSDKGSHYHKPTYKGKIYTIRSIQITEDLPGFGLIFEEIVNSNFYRGLNKYEFDYDPERFRELDTPQSISIEEILEEPVYA